MDEKLDKSIKEPLLLLAENPEALEKIGELADKLNPVDAEKELVEKIVNEVSEVDTDKLGGDAGEKELGLPAVLREMRAKKDNDLGKAFDEVEKVVRNKPAFKKLKKLRSALGLKPSRLPESKVLAEWSLKDAEIEKEVKELVGENPGLFDLLNNYKNRLDNLKKA